MQMKTRYLFFRNVVSCIHLQYYLRRKFLPLGYYYEHIVQIISSKRTELPLRVMKWKREQTKLQSIVKFAIFPDLSVK